MDMDSIEIQHLNPGGPGQRHDIRPQPSHIQIILQVGTVIDFEIRHHQHFQPLIAYLLAASMVSGVRGM